MTEVTMEAGSGTGTATLDAPVDPTGWDEVGYSLVDLPARGPAAPDELSGDARLLAAGAGLPIAALPRGVGRDRAVLRQYVRALNDLIVGPAGSSPTLKLLRAAVPPGEAAGVDAADLRLGLAPLWDAGELAAIEALSLDELEAEWRRRIAGRLPEGAAVVSADPRYAGLWRDMPGGDFDTEGRGRDYTAGMRAFPACRALGVQSLLSLLGAFEPGPRVYVDVLGGEGYVWRLLEAQRQLAQRQVVVLPGAELGADGDPARLPTPLAELLSCSALADPDAVIMAVHAPDGASGDGCAGRLVGMADGRARVSGPLALSGADLVEWLRGTPAADGATGASAALEPMLRARGRRRAPLMITNDVSRHMFYRAGLWGMPTREDALRLSRTFRAGSLDGVLCAYGTHHIPDIPAALRESHAILKPGGCMVVHDFLDRGPVGNWFHDVVDPYSKTGHDMPHLGPVEMAVHLFRAGFRGVELFEIDDPFIFTAEPDDEMGARDLALRYIMGMYGMSESFAHRVDDLEALIHQVLTYPELGETPVFERDFALIPRRAVVARAYRPLAGEGTRFSGSDAALIEALGSALSASPGDLRRRAGGPPEATGSWFGEDGSRWGLSAADQQAWRAWVRGQRAAGALG
ncbi:MAG TPA: methyltransferase domain-containing protein [Longimicrobium sp.]|nr:methyltransferase domain-containing protein [Longimicrobium sp.]